MVKSQQIEWFEIESLVDILCKKVLNLSRTFSSISTVSRGGLVPARLIADCLGIKKIYVDKKKIPMTSLFVDDIFDSGQTFEKIKACAEDSSVLVYATLFARRGKLYPKQLVSAKKKLKIKIMLFFHGMEKNFKNLILTKFFN